MAELFYVNVYKSWTSVVDARHKNKMEVDGQYRKLGNKNRERHCRWPLSLIIAANSNLSTRTIFLRSSPLPL